FEIGHVCGNVSFEQVIGIWRPVEIRFPDNRGQIRTSLHCIQNCRYVDGRFATNPLDVDGTLRTPPGNGQAEEVGCQDATTSRVKSIGFGDAESTSHIASRQVEQVRWNNFWLFTTFNAMPKNTCIITSLTGTTLSSKAIHTTAVFTQMA